MKDINKMCPSIIIEMIEEQEALKVCEEVPRAENGKEAMELIQENNLHIVHRNKHGCIWEG